VRVRRRAFNGKEDVKFNHLCYFIRSNDVPHFTMIHERQLFMLSTCRGFWTEGREKYFLRHWKGLGNSAV